MMKKFSFLLSHFILLFLFCVACHSSQKSPLQRFLQEKLGNAWEVSENGDKLTLTLKEPIWVLLDNKINSVNPTTSQNEEFIKKNGQQTHFHAFLRFEKKWSADQIEQAKNNNRLIYSDVASLQNKFQVTAEMMLHKEEFFGTPKEIEKIKKMTSEGDQLMKQIKPLPDFNWGDLSLFYSEDGTARGDLYAIWPPMAIQTIFQIKQNLETLLASSSH